MTQPIYLVCVDGHIFGTNSKAAIAYLYNRGESTMTVSEWDDPSGDYVPVPQAEFCKW